MYHIVYKSSVIGKVDEQDLKKILVQSRANNTRHHITGLLLLSGDSWMQVLEGEKEAVTAMFRQIEGDLRHTNVYKLSDGVIAERAFPEWSMGFHTATPEDFEQLVGYFNPDQDNFQALRSTHPDEEVLSLLKEFCLEREELI